jgi:hypothetical protein
MKKALFDFLKNYPGFRTNRKIIVIESDDWGSIRMPSKENFNQLMTAIPNNISDRYQENDSLENKADLESLFEVLHSVRDRNGNPAKFTPVAVVANPDYAKIAESNFKAYYYESFKDHLIRTGEADVLQLYTKGINDGFFVPQFHGREHLNVYKWLNDLKAKRSETLKAFKLKMYGIVLPPNEEHYLSAFDFDTKNELVLQQEILVDGLDIFEETFGYKATYFVPPNGAFSSKLNPTLVSNGIQAVQTARLLYPEPLGMGRVKNKVRYFGMKSQDGIRYMLRNAFFEPTDKGNNDWVGSCLSNMQVAFKYNKPAIISSHRVNFMGGINQSNRELGLSQLSLLLKRIVQQWPDAEFMTSGELILEMLRKK